MLFIRHILLSQLLLSAILCLQAVKIGISKPLPITTTMAPNSNTSDSITEETIIETSDTATASTVATINATTTTKASNNDTEWPEFPPKKTSFKTTTKKPITTTPKPSTTTTAITTTILPEEQNATALPEAIPKTSFSQFHYQHKYCFCDLSHDLCDINCCCDLDCSPDALKVFHCLPEKPISLLATEGRFEDFKYQHGLPSCETNDGWLCVFRTYKPIIKEQVIIWLLF